ncbi:MAG TPA: hypothetical protein VKU90_02835 [Caulobacteraceae bacterium]|nr:hypothetical protein [Caulobacteraceae bacterium]
MSAKPQTVQDDLAFMRGLVEAGSSALPTTLGETYLAGGLCYGAQVVVQGAEALLRAPWPAWLNLAVSFGPTLVFAIALTIILVRAPRQQPGGVAARTVGVMFGSIGLANLALIAVIGSVAWRHKSLEIWLIYPCVVFVLQGAAWLVAGAIRRRAWHNLVALGWFATAIAMAVFIQTPALFALAAGVGLIGFMAAPGYALMRLSRAQG